MEWRRLLVNMESGRLRSGWRVAIFLLVVFPLIFILMRVIFPAVTMALQPVPVPDYLGQMVLAATTIPAVLGCSLWALRTLDRLPAQTFGLAHQEGFGVRILVIGVVIGIGIGMLLAIGLLLCGLASMRHHILTTSQLWVLLAACAGVSLVAIAQELTFRGYVFQTLLRGIGPLATLLLTAVAFTALTVLALWPQVRFGPLAVTNLLLLHIFFGMLYLRMGSLWLPLGVHSGLYIGKLLFGIPIPGLALPVTSPFTLTFLQPERWVVELVGPHGELVSALIFLALIGTLSYTRRGLPLESPWWEWRSLLFSPKPVTCWDFAIGARYYQWKLITHDTEED